MNIKNIVIDFENENLLINGEKIKQPIIVEVPAAGGYKRGKIFNFVKGCCRKEKLPKVSVIGENLGSVIISGNTF